MLDNSAANPSSDALYDTPAPVTFVPDSAVDDLPRPPRGRRSATRPAGPPPVAEPPATPVNPIPAGADAPDVEAPDAEAPDAEDSDEPAAAEESPIAEQQATEEAVSEPRRARTRHASPAAEIGTEEASPTPEPGPESAGEDLEAPLATAKAPSTGRRRSARSKSPAEPAASEQSPSAEIEAALSAVEAAAPKRTRRATRSTAGDLVGGQVPTDAEGEVDTQQVLASLAAAIAGRPDTAGQTIEPRAVAEIGPGTQAPALAAPARVPELTTGQGAGGVELVPETPAAEGLDGEVDELEGEETEQDAAASSQRRRRRRGGRRRRRGSAPGAGEDVAGHEDERAETDQQEPEGEEAVEAPQEDGAAAEESDASTSARRRRRRRRRGEGSEAGEEESGDVVVRVREPRRSITDEISGIEGSTRLEAKKQRRREGRAAGRHRAPILTEAEFLARREAVDRVMLVRQRDDYTQLAVLEDDVLVEHYVDRSSSTSLIGNVYLGRVQNVLPSMEAVFIDIGRGRNAVLYAGEVDWDAFDVSADSRKVEKVFKSGQSVLVQVSKDPVGAKGARLTGHVSIPGRYVVYSPGGHLSGISRKLSDAERHRLKQILDTVVSDESSVIVRTAAEGATAEELVQDVERLKVQWQAIEKKAKQGSAPQQLYTEPDLTLRIVRDTFTPDFKQLIVAGNRTSEDVYDQIASYVDHVAPHLAERLVRWNTVADGDPFAEFRIDEQISKALERKVFLPSGGSLVIDRTEAMTVVDVNTGKFTGTGGNLEETVTRNNLEAAEEIVRQLRLRDLGGIIVIDFIDMVLPSNRELLLRRLVECLGRDRTRHQVSEVTSLGLVQMTRKRIGTGLAEAFTDVCEHCGGRGYIRHDEPVESQAPADGGERRGAKPSATTSTRGRGRPATRTRAQAEETPKANQVQPSEAAKQATAKLAAAASRHHAEPDDAGQGEQVSAGQSTPDERPEVTVQEVVDAAQTDHVPVAEVVAAEQSTDAPAAAEQ